MNAELHGMIEGMSNEDYHGGPGISKSHLDVIAKSPRHYWGAYIDPEREPREATPAMRMGTMIHTAILEPDTIGDRMMLMPEDAPTRPNSRQINAKNPSPETVAAIKWWADFEASRAGKEIVTPDEMKSILRVRDVVHSHPVASKLLADGVAEQSYFAKDEETGLLIKCRPDWMTPNGIMVDVKSTEDASPAAFGRSTVNYRYYLQPPWYGDILQRLYGEPPGAFVFIAVEKSRPHACGVYFATKDQVDAGRLQYRKELDLIAEHRERGEWPDYSEEAQPLQLPGWFKFPI